MIKSILVPTDGSTNSAAALEYGIYLAKRFEAEITGIYIVDIRALEGPFFSDISGSLGFTPYQNYMPKFQEILEQKGNLILENFQKMCKENFLSPKIRRLTGIIPNIITEEGKKVDLIIMAQRGEHAQWSSGMLGSTTESVVRKSLRPVLITPSSFHPIDTIMIAYDGSSESNKALKLACELAYIMKVALHVVIVINNEDRAMEILTEAREFIAPYQLNTEIERLRGDAGEEILQYSKDRKVDMIVMGAFGHGRIRELILGGTTSYIMRKANIPVLLNR